MHRAQSPIVSPPRRGNTAQAVLIAAAFFEGWPLLIACPSSLRKLWEDHLREWLPEGMLSQSPMRRIISGRVRLQLNLMTLLRQFVLQRSKAELACAAPSP